jgi:hypothetical protein
MRASGSYEAPSKEGDSLPFRPGPGAKERKRAMAPTRDQAHARLKNSASGSPTASAAKPRHLGLPRLDAAEV